MERTRLGRGLDLLLARSGQEGATEVMMLPASAIAPNPRQPRRTINAEDPEEAELAQSIQANGLLQPVLVRPVGVGRYQLIAGERRFRAMQRLGRTTVPAIVREADDESLLRLALIENIQRKDLNAIEKAEAIKSLIEDFDLTQDEAAKRVGKDRSSVANMLRLLDLSADIRDAVSRGTITMGHARALLAVESPEERQELFKRILSDGLNVRKVEAEAARTQKRHQPKRRAANLESLEETMREHFGTKVVIRQTGRGGKITVHFASHAEFDRLLGLWGILRE